MSSGELAAIADVAVIGAGPVGLMAAALLGDLGHSVALVERHPHLYNLPRAGHIDHEVMRHLQRLGCHERVLADAVLCDTYTLKNGKGELLVEFPWASHGISGWHSDFMMYQPVMEDALHSRVVDDPWVASYRGFEVEELVEHADHVEVVARRPAHEANFDGPATGETRLVVRARYVIGCDGARSFVREWLGARREDLGFSAKWLNVDCRRKRPIALDFDTGQWCDPRRPTTILPLGRRHRRFEWALLPGETAEEMSRPEVAWRLMAEQGLTADDVTIVRQHVWTFEARIADVWRRGRVMIAGDAAHTMPPFQGQGMCSGIRDVANLAWKLDLILRGVSDDGLLDTYQLEREPNLRAWTELSIETGRLPCTLDPEEAERRDEAFRNGERHPMPEIPPMTDGIVNAPGGEVAPGVGELGLQARVERGDTVGLFDDVVGRGFSVISTVADPAAAVGDDHRALIERLGGHFAYVAPDGRVGDVRDTDGAYAAHLRERGWEVVVVRPDFYVFGGGSLRELPEMLADLARMLADRPEPATRTRDVQPTRG